MKLTIPCVIMAGGKSRRMGQDKTLLPFGGYPTLVHYQAARLGALFERVYVSAKGEKFGDLDLPVIVDDPDMTEFAPMIGLSSLFEALPDSRIFVIAADTPFVTAGTIRSIVAWEEGEIVVPETPEKLHALCAVYDRRIVPRLHAHIREGRHKMMAFIAESDSRRVACPDEAEFANLNTPEEYTQAQQRMTDR